MIYSDYTYPLGPLTPAEVLDLARLSWAAYDAAHGGDPHSPARLRLGEVKSKGGLVGASRAWSG